MREFGPRCSASCHAPTTRCTAWLTQNLAARLPGQPGTLYPTLHRLEADGLLVSEQRVVDGRARRVYQATRLARAALTEDRRTGRLAREVLGGQSHTAGPEPRRRYPSPGPNRDDVCSAMRALAYSS